MIRKLLGILVALASLTVLVFTVLDRDRYSSMVFPAAGEPAPPAREEPAAEAAPEPEESAPEAADADTLRPAPARS